MRIHTFKTANKILFGQGVIQHIPEEVRRLGSQKLAIITDPGVRKAGIADKIIKVLDKAKLQWGLWDKVEPEPSVASGEAAIRHIGYGESCCGRYYQSRGTH
jgi:alcohol dehydrogenase class IV